MFATGIFLYFYTKFTPHWTAALVVALGLTAFHLILWIPARQHNLLTYTGTILPAGVFAHLFATGGLRPCPNLWIGIGLTLLILILNRIAWPESRNSTQFWAGILLAALFLSTIAGLLTSL
ncbi:MAG: hypothetical protein K5849_01175 [Bacteroidales bacterium]|nr:hypothetical protein [Bacteroidales bacterium]